MKKIVVNLHIHDGKAKKKAMKAVSSLEGITSLSADSSAGKLTITGDVDPVAVVDKLRCKKWVAIIDSVEDVKKEEKKDDGKKKEEEKKDDGKKKEEEKKDDGKKKDINEQLADYVKAYQNAYPHLTTHYYVQSMEENPNACVIC